MRTSALIFKLTELCVGSLRSARLKRNAPAPHNSASLEPLAHLGRVIVFAPHPDDETLGCGGLIARLVLNRQPIHVIVISDGSASHPRSRKYPPAKLALVRERETRAALVRLGLSDPHAVTFLGLKDGEVPGPASPAFPNVVLAVAHLVRDFAADTVVAPIRNDEHADHRATFHIVDAALDKLLPSRPRLLEYGIWGAPGAADAAYESQCLAYRHYALDVSLVLRRKESAIRKYRSQTGKLIKDDPSGFALSPRTIAKFTTRWELFSEALPVGRS